MSDVTADTERVPDQPCAKCGNDGVSLHYCQGGGWHGTDDMCRYGEPEHFHRNCLRCGYWWRTNDVIKAVVRR